MSSLNRLKRFLPILSGLLLVLVFPRWGLSFLAFFALAPLFVALWVWPERATVLSAWVGGAVFFSISLGWLWALREADVPTSVTVLGWVMLSFYLSLYFLGFAYVCVRLRSKLRQWFFVFLPLAFVAQEYLRSFMLSGFAWFFLGHSQYRNLEMIQIADLFGSYGVTFLLALANALVALVAAKIVERMKRPDVPSGLRGMFVACFALVTLLALAGAFFYGRFRLKEGQLAPGPMVLLVQGNVPQTEKFRRETESEILDRHLALTLSHKGESLDLVVWSETMAPGIPSDDAEVQELFSLLARKMNANVLVGGIGAAGEDEYTNSAFFFRKSVASTLSGRYDKIHLVPFGEFLPFRRFLPWVAARLPYRHDLVAGKERSVFSLDGRTFSPLICYEDTDGPLVRSFKKKGVDFFVLITNDAWFGETSELDQHLASTVFRAIESRSPFARCANTGISCFVDSTGEVRGVLKGPRGKDRAEAASASSVLLLDSRTPLYLRVGDVFARACLVLTLLAFLPFRRLFQVLS